MPESKKVAELLREMQQEKFHIALVTDEYGSVGARHARGPARGAGGRDRRRARHRGARDRAGLGGRRYRVDGKLSIDELNELLDAELPDEEWDTVGGLMLGLLGTIPDEGEQVDVRGPAVHGGEGPGPADPKILITREEVPEDLREEVGAG